MHALILAGGFGTRLRPFTHYIPKPMIPIQGKPILEHLVEQLVLAGIVNIRISLGYKSEVVMNYFGNGSAYGANITYFVETTPLGTGGAVRAASKGMGRFLLLWGDNLSDIDFSLLLKEKGEVVMSLTPRDDVECFGVAKLDGRKIEYFVEKPSREKAPSNLINAGVFVVDEMALEGLPPGNSSLEKHFEMLAKEGRIHACIHAGQWFPTDTLEKYLLAGKNYTKP